MTAATPATTSPSACMLLLQRSNSSPCLGQEHDDEDVAARLAQCSACLQTLSPSAHRSETGRSALKRSPRNDWDEPEINDDGDGYAAKSSTPPTRASPPSSPQNSGSQSDSSDGRRRSGSVSFGTVQIHEHPYLLGCHPDVRKGPPTTLSWCPARSTTTTVEDSPTGQRRKNPLFLRLASTERQARLLATGLYTRTDLDEAAEQAKAVRASRQASAKEASSALQLAMAEAREERQRQEQAKAKSRGKRRGLRRLLSM